MNKIDQLPEHNIVRRVIEEGSGSLHGTGIALGVAPTAVRRWAFEMGYIPSAYAVDVEVLTKGAVTALDVLIAEKRAKEPQWRNWLLAVYRRDAAQFRAMVDIPN